MGRLLELADRAADAKVVDLRRERGLRLLADFKRAVGMCAVEGVRFSDEQQAAIDELLTNVKAILGRLE